MTDRSGPECGSGGVRRRSVVRAAAAAALMGVGACSVPPPRRPDPPPDPAPGLPVAGPRRALLMQVLAHPDDDLYFMNPDTQQPLTAGVPLVCVYVTAGEADGVNKIPGRPQARPPTRPRTPPPATRDCARPTPPCSGCRMFTRWTTSVTDLAGGTSGRGQHPRRRRPPGRAGLPQLAMHTPGGNGLPSLWQRPGLEPAHRRRRRAHRCAGPVAYTYDGLVDVLVGLMERYRPTVVHTLDPDPDIQHSDRGHPPRTASSPATPTTPTTPPPPVHLGRADPLGGPRDRGRREVPGFATTAFRGYYNQHWPDNLPPAAAAREGRAPGPVRRRRRTGSAATRRAAATTTSGGNRPLSNRKGWVRSTHYRYPGARPAVAADPDGRLAAYGVLGLRAVRWRETAPGSGRLGTRRRTSAAARWRPSWARPGRPTAGSCSSGCASPRSADTAAPTPRDRAAGAALPGGGFRAWPGLGNPEPAPTAAAASASRSPSRPPTAGSTSSYATPTRASAPGYGSRTAAGARWRDLGGGEVQDGLSAVVDGRGRVHVYGGRPGHRAPLDPGRARAAADRSTPARRGAGARVRPRRSGSPTAVRRALLPGRARARPRRHPGHLAAADGFDGYGPVRAADSPPARCCSAAPRGPAPAPYRQAASVRDQGPAALDGPALHIARPAGARRRWAWARTPPLALAPGRRSTAATARKRAPATRLPRRSAGPSLGALCGATRSESRITC